MNIHSFVNSISRIGNFQPTTRAWLYGKRQRRENDLDARWNVNVNVKCQLSIDFSLESCCYSYRVWRRHSFNHLFPIVVQVILIGSNRWVGAGFHKLWQVAQWEWRRRSGAEFQVWFGTRRVGETGRGHREKEIIRQWLDRLIMSVNYINFGRTKEFAGRQFCVCSVNNIPIKK